MTDLANPDLAAILTSPISGNFHHDSHLFDTVHDFLLTNVPMDQKILAASFLVVEVMGEDKDDIGSAYVEAYIEEIMEYRNADRNLDDIDLDTPEVGLSLCGSTMTELYDHPDLAPPSGICENCGSNCGNPDCSDDQSIDDSTRAIPPILEYSLDQYPLDRLIETPDGYLCPVCRKNDMEQVCYWDEGYCPSCGANNNEFLMSHNEGGF